MGQDWFEEVLSRKPEEFEQLNKNTYIQRRNVTPFAEDGMILYRAESRKISKAMYEILSANKADVYINSEDALTIMSALTDLYELLLGKEG